MTSMLLIEPQLFFGKNAMIEAYGNSLPYILTN